MLWAGAAVSADRRAVYCNKRKSRTKARRNVRKGTVAVSLTVDIRQSFFGFDWIACMCSHMVAFASAIHRRNNCRRMKLRKIVESRRPYPSRLPNLAVDD